MRKRDELSNPNSCLTKALDDERLFVLLARDPAAPVAIRAWVEERIRLGKNRDGDPQIVEARGCADRMECERDLASVPPATDDEVRKVMEEALHRSGDPNMDRLANYCDVAKGCVPVSGWPADYPSPAEARKIIAREGRMRGWIRQRADHGGGMAGHDDD